MFIGIKRYLDMFLQTETTIKLVDKKLKSDLEYSQIPLLWRNILWSEQSVEEKISAIWSASNTPLERCMDYLIQKVSHLTVVSNSALSQFVGLLYIFEIGDRQCSWLGYPPIDETNLPARELHILNRLPRSITDIYHIHNGFLRDGWDSLGCRGLNQIVPLSSIYTAGDDSYNPESLLAISGDGSGNEYCVDINDNSGQILLWDHETRDLENVGNFSEFLCAFMKKEMRF